MKALILAAGLGTRLKPWTLSHPKALVPVGGIPMLERVLVRMRDQGFDRVVVNVHHFSDQIIDYLDKNDFGLSVSISDESERLLDTGGAILKASTLLMDDNAPFVVHNVDILSDAPLSELMEIHVASGRDISLVTSSRESKRKLVFDRHSNLCGWHNCESGQFRPSGFEPSGDMHENSFSGIYFVSPSAITVLKEYSASISSEMFPVMDFFLDSTTKLNIGEIKLDKLDLIDIGKPDTLRRADALFGSQSLR